MLPGETKAAVELLISMLAVEDKEICRSIRPPLV
jgi:hypothetical protein